jgi:hypothetical protein
MPHILLKIGQIAKMKKTSGDIALMYNILMYMAGIEPAVAKRVPLTDTGRRRSFVIVIAHLPVS